MKSYLFTIKASIDKFIYVNFLFILQKKYIVLVMKTDTKSNKML